MARAAGSERSSSFLAFEGALDTPSLFSICLAIVLAACAPSVRPAVAPAQSPEPLIAYRLLTRADFQAQSSNHRRGAGRHGAEICVRVRAAADVVETGNVDIFMRPHCSYWSPGEFRGANRPHTQYVLQHEQIHFAIGKLATLLARERIRLLLAAERTSDAITEIIEDSLHSAESTHAKFDANTSGVYDPVWMESWVNVLERKLEPLCSTCPVRILRQ